MLNKKGEKRTPNNTIKRRYRRAPQLGARFFFMHFIFKKKTFLKIYKFFYTKPINPTKLMITGSITTEKD